MFPFKSTKQEGVNEEVNNRRLNDWELDDLMDNDMSLNAPRSLDDKQVQESPHDQPTIESELTKSVVLGNELVRTDATTNEPSQQPNVMRRSGGMKKQTKHLESYETKFPESIDYSRPTSNPRTSEVYPLSQYISYD